MSTFHKVESPFLLTDGTVTVLLTNGRNFTYRLRTVTKGALEGKRIVELLTGPDNDSSYRGFGFVNHLGVINLWKKCRTEAYEKHAALLCGMANEHVDEWMQSARCIRCGRQLTDPESIRLSMGPTCRGESGGRG